MIRRSSLAASLVLPFNLLEPNVALRILINLPIVKNIVELQKTETKAKRYLNEVNGVTRGNGIVGENVTVNVKTIKSIPLTIQDKNEIEIRGEVYLSKSEFEKINNEKLQNGEPLFANPRNAAAGTIRQLDSKVVADRNLDAFLYYYLNDADKEVTKQSESLQKISNLGLKVNKEGRICNSLQEVKDYIDEYTLKRDSFDYEIDGIVIKINDFKLQEQLGYTAKTPRTGKITYNAKLQPVQLAGTMVEAATLNNAEYIMAKGLKIGANVKVKKAGDIIPEVINVILDDEYNKLSKKNEGEVDQFCVNFTCPAQILRSLEHFVSRNALNIVGLGDKKIEKLFNAEIIKTVADIFQIKEHEEEIIAYDKFGQKSFDNLVNAIESSKEVSFEKVLFGLGIRHVGSKTAKILAQLFSNVDNLMKATFEELNSVIANKSFVITGTLSKSRDFFQSLIELQGGKIIGSVSQKTDYLLIGENAGSKEEKAKKLNVKIITEQDLMNLIGE
ncbi:hypothetical protein FQA39_LY12955 [Lamprigera yunnana]|nr:hypothetical protein FQA39_LY12955 [Lamprigera yunnana]